MYNLSDIFQSLRADHNQIARQLRVLNEKSDVSQRAVLFARVASDLKIHSAAEEEAVYSRLRNLPETQTLAEKATEAHDDIDRLLAQLGARRVDGGDWVRLFEELKDNVLQHVDEEEKEIFTQMRKLFTEPELREIGILFQEAKEKIHTQLARAA